MRHSINAPTLLSLIFSFTFALVCSGADPVEVEVSADPRTTLSFRPGDTVQTTFHLENAVNGSELTIEYRRYGLYLEEAATGQEEFVADLFFRLNQTPSVYRASLLGNSLLAMVIEHNTMILLYTFTRDQEGWIQIQDDILSNAPPSKDSKSIYSFGFDSERFANISLELDPQSGHVIAKTSVGEKIEPWVEEN